MMKDPMSVNLLSILDRSVKKELGAGNLGVLIARAGVGKTACLIHIALSKILCQEKLIHVTLEESAEKVTAYYDVRYADYVAALDITDETDTKSMLDRNRMILAYLNQSFDIKRLRTNLRNLVDSLKFNAKTVILDGIDFETVKRETIERVKRIAVEFNVEVWFAALSHRHIDEVNEMGIPYPCHQLDDLFDVILYLQPKSSGLYLNLLKDHQHTGIRNTYLKLDQATFFPVKE